MFALSPKILRSGLLSLLFITASTNGAFAGENKYKITNCSSFDIKFKSFNSDDKAPKGSSNSCGSLPTHPFWGEYSQSTVGPGKTSTLKCASSGGGRCKVVGIFSTSKVNGAVKVYNYGKGHNYFYAPSKRSCKTAQFYTSGKGVDCKYVKEKVDEYLKSNR
ncbi:MAG: hypothetical protein AAFX54_03035 [Pseudomonadota bacterium]